MIVAVAADAKMAGGKSPSPDLMTMTWTAKMHRGASGLRVMPVHAQSALLVTLGR
jgi:hypothetical protein